MSQDARNDWKTAWEQAVEEEWVNEQWAANEERRAYQNPGWQLQPEAAAALGTMSPDAAWLQITTLLSAAIEENWEEANKLGQELGIGGYWTHPRDLDQLRVRAIELNPIFAINEFNYVNPEIRLDESRLPGRISPLEALRMVIRMWTDNSHRSEAL